MWKTSLFCRYRVSCEQQFSYVRHLWSTSHSHLNKLPKRLKYMQLDDRARTNYALYILSSTDIITYHFIVSIANKTGIVHTVIWNYFGTFANFLYNCLFDPQLCLKTWHESFLLNKTWCQLVCPAMIETKSSAVHRCVSWLWRIYSGEGTIMFPSWHETLSVLPILWGSVFS